MVALVLIYVFNLVEHLLNYSIHPSVLWNNMSISEQVYVKFDIGDTFVDTFQCFIKVWQN
jgi:hypothetical protein